MEYNEVQYSTHIVQYNIAVHYSTVGCIGFEYEWQTNLNFKFNILEEVKREKIYSTI